MIPPEYRELAVIGSGATGCVSKLVRRKDERPFVVKKIDYGDLSRRERERLVAEVNILASLVSPYIVRYVERVVDVERGKLGIIMEFCGGGDIQMLVKQARRRGTGLLPEAFGWRVAVALTGAFSVMHPSIVHRDVKPSNILLTETGQVKLGDFGLARHLDEAGLTYTHVGTPLYMAPELLSGRGYGPAVDLWGLGCVMYECAALLPPFRATNERDLHRRIRANARDPMPLAFSLEYRTIVDRLLKLDPTTRATVADLKEAPRIGVELREKRLHYQWAALKEREAALAAREAAVAAREAALGVTEGSGSSKAGSPYPLRSSSSSSSSSSRPSTRRSSLAPVENSLRQPTASGTPSGRREM
jgi:NIMA (never in mitosis gene a)-related kinase